MNKQQTAVEWLIEQFTNLQNGVFCGFPVLSLDEVFKQAKEMEKKQIEHAFEDGMNAANIQNLQQYYNEIYGTED